jgi:hypothetical protein
VLRFTQPVALLITLVCLAPTGRAQQQPPAKPTPADWVTRSYDVADLIRPAPDTPAVDPPKTLSADMPIGVPPPSRTDPREALVKFFREVIEPKSWQPAGTGTLSIKDDTLIVTQTVQNQREIARILGELRDNGTRPVWDALKRRMPAGTRFDKTEFAQAVAAVAKVANVPIKVDYGSLAKFNVEFDTPVTADVSGMTGDRAVRTLIRAAANLEVPVRFDATPDTAKVALDRTPDDTQISAAFDVRQLPARVAGLDPTKAYPREQILDALVERVKKEFNLKDVRADKSGLLIIGAPHKTQLQLRRFFEDLEPPLAATPDKPSQPK